MNKLILFLLVILLLPMVFAVPKTSPFQTAEGSNSLDIRGPTLTYLKMGVNHTFNVHVFNKTNGIPYANTKASCNIDFYNLSGKTAYSSLMEKFGTFEYTETVPGTIFNTEGHYSYIIWCNTSIRGGFTSEPLRVNKLGREPIDPTGPAISSILFILVITGVLFIVPFFIKFDKNEFSNNMFKRGSWIIAIYLMMLNTGAVMSLASIAGLPVLSELTRYLWLLGLAGWLSILYFVLMMLFDIIENFTGGKKKNGV